MTEVLINGCLVFSSLGHHVNDIDCRIDCRILAIGEVAEIKPIEKALRRAWQNGNSSVWPSHCDAPKYTPGRVYGIIVERGQHHDTYYVSSASTVLRTLGLC